MKISFNFPFFTYKNQPAIGPACDPADARIIANGNSKHNLLKIDLARSDVANSNKTVDGIIFVRFDELSWWCRGAICHDIKAGA